MSGDYSVEIREQVPGREDPKRYRRTDFLGKGGFAKCYKV